MHPVKMGTLPGTSEIEELDSELKIDGNAREHRMLKPGQKYSIEDDINQLFETIDSRMSGRSSGQQGGKETFRKNAMKRPIRGGSSPASGIGISESLSLKQALRGLCISQASEMAAMKRLSKPAGSSRVSEAGTIKNLYRAVVVQATESGLPLNEGKGNLVEISLVPERSSSNFSRMMPESPQGCKMELSNQTAHSSTLMVDMSTEKSNMKTLPQDEIVPLPAGVGYEIPNTESGKNGKVKSMYSSTSIHASEKLPVLDEIVPASVEVLTKSVRLDEEQKGKLHSASYRTIFNTGGKVTKSASASPHLIKPVLGNKSVVKKKVNQDSTSTSSSSNQCNGGFNSDLGPSGANMVCQTPICTLKNESKEKVKASPTSSSTNVSIDVSSSALDSGASKPGFSSNCAKTTKTIATKPDERSREKGEFSLSSKSSIGEYSCSTSISDESNLSGSSRSGYRTSHVKRLEMGSHSPCSEATWKLRFETLQAAQETWKKMARAQTEKEILQMLDHPFLPTLFAHFTTDKYSCLVMEYCPGGDLHVLRQKQPGKSFSEQAARFYVAEILLALEYLHMLGVVYRDLKPENILVREDGHIMLSDFDLSLRCSVNPTLLKSSAPTVEPPKRMSSPCTVSSCMEPFCLHPSWQVPCFTPRLLSAAAKARKLKSELAAQINPLPQLVVEPTDARSNSFVGTYEYLAPEIIKGEGHGSAVDWWTFGIFLYELLYGKTPFKGAGNEDTLANAVSLSLKFPPNPTVSFHARDLIRGLLIKEPQNRLGSVKGAAEIKQHPFFEGLNWALIRCAIPPELPKFYDLGNVVPDISSQNESTKGQKEFQYTEEDLEFDMF
ncbi:hypothetical protein F0562_001887 [Nyssa sinensis]|uniref:non-specific serine/threonine protein kinase n=1 Tax=Nyssa sinensis TaxID=561372 RepID=A0A5J5C486_9ASTE|nr:hypothetical protein F0562_001887 [Nyssa sinensis]